MDLNTYLGENSYPSIKQKLFESINNCTPETIRGKQMIDNLIVTLNESAIPMMEIKQFQTNAESVSKEDVKIKEILDFIKKENAAGDFNYLINLCKEEHLLNEKRSGVPAPEQTLTEINHLFDAPSNEVIKAIKNNLFGDLSSDLYGEIRQELSNAPSIAPETGFGKSVNKINKPKVDGLKQLNENGNLSVINPIAVKYVQLDANIYLTPFSAFSVEIDDNSKKVWKPVHAELPPSYNRLADALQVVEYDYDNNEFVGNSELWDFDIRINNEGIPQVVKGDNRIDVALEDLEGLFVETLSIPTEKLKSNFDVATREADAFVALANNYNKLIKLDEISIVKNDNYFIVVDDAETKPNLITAKDTNQVSFDSFNHMVAQLNESFGIGANVKNIFNDQLKNEIDLLAERNEVLMQLNENQSTLNQLIQSTESIKSAAEDGSPAKKRAIQELSKLNESLDINLKELQKLKQSKLYE